MTRVPLGVDLDLGWPAAIEAFLAVHEALTVEEEGPFRGRMGSRA